MPQAPLQALPCGDALALFRRLFSHSGDAALLTRPGGEFLAANAAACAMFGAPEADLLERSREGGHRTLTDATDRRLAAAIEARARDGSVRAEMRLRRKSGALFDAEMSSVLFLDGGAEPISLMTVRDISAERMLQAAGPDEAGPIVRPQPAVMAKTLKQSREAPAPTAGCFNARTMLLALQSHRVGGCANELQAFSR